MSNYEFKAVEVLSQDTNARYVIIEPAYPFVYIPSYFLEQFVSKCTE